MFQVRAKTSAAEGRWSELVSLGKFIVINEAQLMSLQFNASYHVQVARILRVPLALCMSESYVKWAK